MQVTDNNLASGGIAVDARLLSSGIDDRVARSVLGANDDIVVRDAMQRFRVAQRALLESTSVTSKVVASVGQASEALRRAVVIKTAEATVASSLANTQGIVAYDTFLLACGWTRIAQASERLCRDPKTALAFIDVALEHFRTALRYHPENVEARYNLELLWWLREGLAAQYGGAPGEGAGSDPPGGGY